MKRYYSLDMAIFVGICLAAIALLSGCAQYPRYHTALPTKARPKLPTYVQCDKKKVCRVYDSRGNRRYDLERR